MSTEETPNATPPAATPAPTAASAAPPTPAVESAPEPAAEPAPEPTAPTAPEPEITPETLRAYLLDLRASPDPTQSLADLNDLRDWRLHPKLLREVVDTASALVDTLVASGPATPPAQAHMVILFAALLSSPHATGAIDQLYARWIRHAGTFGPGRATPPSFQKPEFVQRFADLVGWGELQVGRDREAIERFLDWVESWALRNRFKIRRTLETLQRNFPAPGLWTRVTYKA